MESLLRSVLNCKHSLVRSNFRAYSSKLDNILTQYFQPTTFKKPPYSHICQIGDPVLRSPCRTVHPDEIKCDGFQKFVNHLIAVMRKYDSYGISAPQIGMPIQVIVIETTQAHLKDTKSMQNAGQQIEVIPLKVFINPKMTILDFNATEYPECCMSIVGFSAHVPRAKRIRVEALDLLGNSFTWEGENWPAKVLQHEMDHLQGVLFVDKMNTKTFSCVAWDIVNNVQGKMAMEFYPVKKSKLRKIFTMGLS